MRRVVNASTQRALSERCMERCRWRRHWIRRSSARSAQAATTVPAREHGHIRSRRERSPVSNSCMQHGRRALRPRTPCRSGIRALRESADVARNLYRIAYSCRAPLHQPYPVTRRLQSSTAIQPSTLYSSTALYSIQPLQHPSDSTRTQRTDTFLSKSGKKSPLPYDWESDWVEKNMELQQLVDTPSRCAGWRCHGAAKVEAL